MLEIVEERSSELNSDQLKLSNLKTRDLKTKQNIFFIFSHWSENPDSLTCIPNENQILIFKLLCNQFLNYLPTKSTDNLHVNPYSNHSNEQTAPASPTLPCMMPTHEILFPVSSP